MCYIIQVKKSVNLKTRLLLFLPFRGINNIYKNNYNINKNTKAVIMLADPKIYPEIIVFEKIFNDSLLRIELSDFASKDVVMIINIPIIINPDSI